MEKIPCIKCNSQLWEYIKPYLERWGYIISGITDWTSFPILVLNFDGIFGECSNVGNISKNRELLTDVEKFLEEAAKLKGHTYKRKNIMEINGIEIKPGMVIEIEIDDKSISYVVFPLLDGELGMISYSKSSWDRIEYFIRHYSSKIVCIHDLTSTELGGLTSGEVLWEKPKEVVLTMGEIADKFGVPVEQLRIKE